MIKEHSRTLIFDLDDTISFTVNRDWEHAIPNINLINKSNDLYKNGWKIIIITSRGNLSCSSRKEAETKYRAQIEKWLKENNVLYDELSFEKKLGVFYIDDKALRPDEFIKMTFREYNNGSWSDGNFIHIEDPNAFDTIKWYEAVKEGGFNVPKIHAVTGKNITREYFLEENKFHELIEFNNRKNKVFTFIGLIKDTFEKTFKFTLTRPSYAYTYDNYIDYIKSIIADFKDKDSYEDLIQNLEKFRSHYEFEFNNLSKMFYHGNLTIQNVAYKFNEIYFLNPDVKNGYSNPIIDIATFCASLLHNVMSIEKYTIDESCYIKIKKDIYYSICQKWVDETIFNNLIIVEFIRLYKDEELTKQALLLV